MNNEQRLEKTTWTDTDGYTVTIRHSDNADTAIIEVHAPSQPQSNKSCIGYSSQIEAVLLPYEKALRKLGKDPARYRSLCGLPFREAAVPFVESVLAELRAAREATKSSLAARVPGLDVLRAALSDELRYAQQFERMMDDEYNDGARPPKPVKVGYQDLAPQYPAAVAYLKAEAWENASHYAKCSAGRKAKKRIAAGEDFTVAIQEMEANWSNHCDEHAFD